MKQMKKEERINWNSKNKTKRNETKEDQTEREGGEGEERSKRKSFASLL